MSDVENQQVGIPDTTSSTKRRGKNGQSRPSSGKAKKGKGAGKAEVFCLCQGKNDGRPMIRCDASCRNWYVMLQPLLKCTFNVHSMALLSLSDLILPVGIILSVCPCPKTKQET